MKENYDLYEKIFSASIGALVVSLIATPLDVVKVRLQSRNPSVLTQRLKDDPCFVTSTTKPSLKNWLLFLFPRAPATQHESFLYCSRLYDHVEPAKYFSKNVPIYWNLMPIEIIGRKAGGKPAFEGTFGGIYFILKNEGISSLWRGLFPTLLMSIPSTVVYFVGYEHFRNHSIWHYLKDHQSGLPFKESIDIVSPLICGALSRTCAATIISPIELVRTRMQSISYTKQNLSSVFKDILTMIKKDGYLSLWKGLFPTLWRDVPFSAIYWLGYEKAKVFYMYLFQNSSNISSSDNVLISFGAGCTSGMIAATLTTPFDVAKTRRQIQGLYHMHAKDQLHLSTERSVVRILQQIWSENGLKGLFRGLGARVVKVAPACGTMISCYEWGKYVFKNNFGIQ